jgi:hypothetical protein
MTTVGMFKSDEMSTWDLDPWDTAISGFSFNTEDMSWEDLISNPATFISTFFP